MCIRSAQRISQVAILSLVAVAALFNADRAHAQTNFGSAATLSQAQAEREIRATLDQWRDSFLNPDLKQNVACYAPSLTRYFNNDRVPLARVQSDKKHAFAQIKNVRQFDL